jgi:hypothetical protein
LRYDFNFQNIVQNKQSLKGQKFAQSGHPVPESGSWSELVPNTEIPLISSSELAPK